MTNEETLQGAKNRAKYLKENYPDGEFYVGIEGGIQSIGEEMEAFAWIVVTNKDGLTGKAQTSTFQLPSRIVELIQQGVELGHADDLVFNRKNSKQGNGAVGILTGDVIDRIEYYRHAVILALIPFINKKLYLLIFRMTNRLKRKRGVFECHVAFLPVVHRTKRRRQQYILPDSGLYK